jgi:SWI/SNF-related matrix-associated actin-dependent regulator of chromatin subfamily A protein 2/4
MQALFKHRKSLFEGFWQSREGRVARNKGVAKYHEKMNKDFAKKKDEDRNRRMEALKANDVDQYRKLLEEQKAKELPGDANEHFAVRLGGCGHCLI